MNLSFKFKCSFADQVWYEILDGTRRELVVRHRISDYWIKQANGDDVRESMRQSVGRVWFDNLDVITPQIVSAFNAWRQQEHVAHMRHLRAHPEKYGEISDDDLLFQPDPIWIGQNYDCTLRCRVDLAELETA